MDRVILDGTSIETPDQFHDLFLQALDLPAYYGRNLDALHDCLTDLTGDVTIEIRNHGLFCGRLGPWGRSALHMLRCTSRENPHITLAVQAEKPGEE